MLLLHRSQLPGRERLDLLGGAQPLVGLATIGGLFLLYPLVLRVPVLGRHGGLKRLEEVVSRGTWRGCGGIEAEELG
jgi:hypothetical protein